MSSARPLRVDTDLPYKETVIGELHLPPQIWGVYGLDFDGRFFWLTETYRTIYKIRVLEWEDATPTPPFPATFWVGEPYPNPFNMSVSIPYSIGPGQECEIVV
ncbi:hypothetical protein KKG05_01740, partial [bacterium]|nr:hypothetical protein [bacterium]